MHPAAGGGNVRAAPAQNHTSDKSRNPFLAMTAILLVVESLHPLVDPPGVEAAGPLSGIWDRSRHTSHLVREGVLNAFLYGLAYCVAFIY